MKFAIPEISWHNRDPVLSVDFQPKAEPNGPNRLASGGTDTHVLIWYVTLEESGSVNLEVAADLARHQKSVNVVRWSPNGLYLASGDDESIIFVWKQKTEESLPSIEGEEQYKETWVVHKTLRGHVEDVLDLCWSRDSTQLASGSVDNKLLLWDMNRGRYTDIVSDHKGFVQGVAWDPQGQFIATASSDRVFRTIDIATKKVMSRSSKAVLPFPKDHPLHEVKVRLYHDDTLQTYYRRLQFSPDGLLIAVPAGRIEPEQGKLDTKPINAVYIYTRYSLKVPVCVIPCAEPALAVRWARAGARAGAGAGRSAFPGAARALLAVATRRALLLYDTCQRTPLALLTNAHYTRLTDLTWSPDNRMLVASSTDGFCSILTFSKGELGELVTEENIIAEKTKPMEVTEEPTTESKAELAKTNNGTPKIDMFIKFKTPTEKSPKKPKIETEQKTPVKLDVLVETAMQSWSDNSSNDIIRPKEPVEVKKDEVMIIDDSEDIKLVYDDTEKSQSPKEGQNKIDLNKSNNESKSDINKSDNKSKADIKNDTTTAPQKDSCNKMSPKGTPPPKLNSFLKQAKLTDVKEPATAQTALSPRAPRRVSFVTLSSPKNKKKC